MRSVVEDVITTLQPLVQKKSNTIEVVCPHDIGQMRADVTKVRQILFNLLSNACKFTENGKIRVDVGPAENTDGQTQQIRFVVTDDGIGMSEEELGKLFQPFTQADASTTRKFGGTGLGLAISRRFAEMMGGTISVVSKPGEGSAFTLLLPVQVFEASPTSEGHFATAPAGGRTTVLVIDDDSAVRDTVSRSLAPMGVRTISAPSGDEGLRLARKHHPNLIFLDVLMPRMDGWSVLTTLKADPDVADIPVVMLTVFHESEMGFMLGAAEHLTKPVDRDRLASLLAKYTPKLSSPTVLVVEDDPPTREVLERSLTRLGWNVEQAENGRVALERTNAGPPPGLVLLDLMMPQMNGFEFLEEMRRRKAWDNVPVIVLTSKDLTAAENQRLRGHVERIVQKGAYTRDELRHEIQKIVSSYVRTPANAGVESTPTDERQG